MSDDKEKKAKKIQVNSSCIGCGMCVSLASDIFEINDEGMAEVIVDQEDRCEEAGEAIDMCPVQAIECVDEEE